MSRMKKGTLFALGLLLIVSCGDDRTSKTHSTSTDAGATDSDSSVLDPNDTSASGGGGGGAGTGGRADCVDIAWGVEPKVINMLILLDRSQSMALNRIDNATYAQVVQNAIDQVVLANTEAGVINFALAVFPSPQTCPANADQQNMTIEAQCTPASGDPLVAFADEVTVDTHQAIVSALDAVGQCGGTPIADSLQWAHEYLAAEKLPPGDTYVLLATDGAPNCNPNASVSTCSPSETGATPQTPYACLDDRRSYNQALSLALAGYRVFVVGVGTDVQDFAEVMNGIAYFGSRQSPPATMDVPASTTYFFPAEDADKINTAFQDITNQVVDCEFAVDWITVPDTTPAGEIVNKACADINLSATPTEAPGTTVPLYYAEDCNALSADQYGWYWVESPEVPFDDIRALGTNYDKCSHIRLCPSTCDNLKVTDGVRRWSEISATFGCESRIYLLE